MKNQTHIFLFDFLTDFSICAQPAGKSVLNSEQLRDLNFFFFTYSKQTEQKSMRVCIFENCFIKCVFWRNSVCSHADQINIHWNSFSFIMEQYTFFLYYLREFPPILWSTDFRFNNNFWQYPISIWLCLAWKFQMISGIYILIIISTKSNSSTNWKVKLVNTRFYFTE